MDADEEQRDAEIERLRAGIRELQSGITNMAKRYSWLDGDLEDALLEQFEKCGALLKGGAGLYPPAEIEHLRQGITRLKALASLPGDSPGLPLMRLGMIRQEATELLKGGGDGC